MTMKKRFLVFAMIACVLGLTACGSASQTNSSGLSAEELQYAEWAGDMCFAMDAYVYGDSAVLEDEEASWYIQQYGQFFDAAATSWKATSEELGRITAVDTSSASVTISDEQLIAEVSVTGDKEYKPGKIREATVVVELTQTGITFTENIKYDMGELMIKAGLNTLLGMGTVFAVLILISLIIACFNLIPKITGMFAKKAKEDVKAVAVDNTIAQIAQKEEAEDDLELIAVISAAIAASEGAASADGYVVRSIIRR